MLVGAMNNPAAALSDEILRYAGLGLDFIDITLEPPMAASTSLNCADVKRSLDGAHLAVVGHTAYYLPIASPFNRIRRAAIDELKSCIDCFREIGAEWMNIHPDAFAPFYKRAFVIEQNLRSLEELLRYSKSAGIGLMLENVPGQFNTEEQLAELLDPLPSLALHLDIGHCNLQVGENTAESLITRFGPRIRHVHLHDNRGGAADLHLPLGAGSLSYEGILNLLKLSGYDGTITLEVFSPDEHYLIYSAKLLKDTWNRLAE